MDDLDDPLTQAALSDPAAQTPPEVQAPSPHWRLVILLMVAIAALAIVFRR